MKTRGQKVGELIDALDNGFILFKEHGDPIWKNKEFLVKFENYYEMKGWGTALGSVENRLYEIMENPDSWKIFPNFNIKVNDYPYPWSSKWEENE
jgi:hypothetical protein